MGHDGIRAIESLSATQGPCVDKQDVSKFTPPTRYMTAAEGNRALIRPSFHDLFPRLSYRNSAMSEPVQLLDVVALNQELPDQHLVRGQVGTVVEVLAPEVFEVEFSDDHGKTYAMLPLRSDQLIVLHTSPVQAG
jgi:hypothetical protein